MLNWGSTISVMSYLSTAPRTSRFRYRQLVLPIQPLDELRGGNLNRIGTELAGPGHRLAAVFTPGGEVRNQIHGEFDVLLAPATTISRIAVAYAISAGAACGREYQDLQADYQ
jgi:hypothetical protein